MDLEQLCRLQRLLASGVHVHPHRAAGAHRPDHGVALVDLDPARPAASGVMDRNDDLVTCVRDLLDLHVLGRKAIVPGVEEVAKPGQSAVGALAGTSIRDMSQTNSGSNRSRLSPSKPRSL